MSDTFKFNIKNANKRLLIKQDGSDRLKTLGVIQDIDTFIVSLWQALQIHDPKLVFEPAYPPYVLDKEDAGVLRDGRDAPEIPEKIITWNVVRRTPGSVDHKPFARSREIRPRIREELVYVSQIDADPLEEEQYKGPTHIGMNINQASVLGMEVKGQWFDNLIQFDIWSKNNKTAEKQANYLENFMEDFHGMFIELGVNKMHFHSRIRDDVLLNWRNGLVNRSLLYYVRTERIIATPVREIKVIEVSADVRELLNRIDNEGADKYIANERDYTIKKWVERNLELYA